jgi:hypothetical protein
MANLKRKRTGGSKLNRYAKYAKTAYNTGKAVYGATKKIQKWWKNSKKGRKSYKKAIIDKPIRSPNNGLSNSYTSIRSKPDAHRSSMRAITGVQAVKYTQTTVQASLQGRQGVGAQFFGHGDLWFNYINSTLANIGSTATPIIGLTKECIDAFCESITVKYIFTNASPESIVLYLYDVVPKTTTTSNRDTAVRLNCVDQWGVGLADIEGAQTNGTNYWGNEPTETKAFNINYRVWKKRRIELGPGRSHEHIVHHRIAKYLDTSKAAESFQMRDFGFETLYVIHGLPTDDSKTLGGGNVTLAQAKVDFVFQATYKYRLCSMVPRNMYRSGELPNTLTNQYMQDENTLGVVDVGVTTNFA